MVCFIHSDSHIFILIHQGCVGPISVAQTVPNCVASNFRGIFTLHPCQSKTDLWFQGSQAEDEMPKLQEITTVPSFTVFEEAAVRHRNDQCYNVTRLNQRGKITSWWLPSCYAASPVAVPKIIPARKSRPVQTRRRPNTGQPRSTSHFLREQLNDFRLHVGKFWSFIGFRFSGQSQTEAGSNQAAVQKWSNNPSCALLWSFIPTYAIPFCSVVNSCPWKTTAAHQKMLREHSLTTQSCRFCFKQARRSSCQPKAGSKA